jgi:FixJ family two-component response regulator
VVDCAFGLKAQFAGPTLREREVAALVAKGRSNRAVATNIVARPRTRSSAVRAS